MCVPPNRIVIDKCEIDPMFIQEHILEILGDTDYRSLKGKVYKAYDHELHLVSQNGKEVYCSILSNDIFFTGQDGLSIKRYMVSNTLDQRFFEKLENAFLDGQGESSAALQRPSASPAKGKAKIMRDPYEFNMFFKQNVYHEVDDTYHDFLEDIKILRENHIMVKGHEKT